MRVLNKEIEFCGKCPYCQYDNYSLSYECVRDRNTPDEKLGHIDYTEIMKKIPPDWCPLPTKQV